MSYYQSCSNISRYASPAYYARASPQQYSSQTVGRRSAITNSRPVTYSDSDSDSSDSDSDSDSDDEDESRRYQRRGAVTQHRPSASSYSSSRQPSRAAPSAHHAAYQHQPQYTSQHQSAPVQRSSSPRGYMMQSNTTARMGMNMLTQAPNTHDPVASYSEDRRRPLPGGYAAASSSSRYGSVASAASSGGWGASGSVSSSSSRRPSEYVEFRPAVYPGGSVSSGKSSSSRRSRR